METGKVEALKKRIDEYGRKEMAIKVGMAYMTLSSKLNFFIAISDDEIAAIEKVLKEGAS